MSGKDKICTNIRADLYDKYAYQVSEVGPTYVPPSSFADQTLSINTSAPKLPFGKSTRDDLFKATSTPSPVAYNAAYSTFEEGTVPLSRVKSPPKYSFRLGREEVDKWRFKGGATPGPSLEQQSALGSQTLSVFHTAATMRIGSAGRFGEKPSSTPGPASYPGASPPSFGTQVLSSKRTGASISFRLGREEVDKALKGAKDTPGPSLIPPDALGEQPLSTKRSEAKVVFGKSARSPAPKGGSSPGPGQYSTYEAFGKQPLSTKKTSMASTFCAR